MSGIHQTLANGDSLFHTGEITAGTYTSGTNEEYGYNPDHSPPYGSYTTVAGAVVTHAYTVNHDGGPFQDWIVFAADLPGDPTTIQVKVGAGAFTTFNKYGATGTYEKLLSSGDFWPGSGTHAVIIIP